ncbi:efflux RND transporter periplasmic adaptor subunit [Thermostilla marina]
MKLSGLWHVLRTTIPLLGGLVVLTLIILWLSGFFVPAVEPGESELIRPKLDPTTETTAEVEVVYKPYVVETVGEVKAAERTVVSARVMSTIEKIHVRAGDVVKQGDVLIELDRAAIQRKLNQAEAALEAAEAAVAQAKDRFDRAQRLREQNPGAMSDQQFNEIASGYQQALAQRDQAQQAVEEARVNLSYCTITAPRDGKIVDRLAEEGEVAQPGVPLLSMYDPATLRLEAPVMEHLAGHLEVGQKVEVVFDSLGGTTITGTVDEKVPQADALSRSVLVKVSLPPTPGLLEGMTGILRIPAGQRRHLCLDVRAIRRIGQLEFVEVVRDDGTKERRIVKIGRLGRPGHIEVLSGVEAGEKVVVPKDGTPPTECPDCEPTTATEANASS